MKIYDAVLWFAGSFCAGCGIGALLLQHYTESYQWAIAATIGFYYGRRFWRNLF